MKPQGTEIKLTMKAVENGQSKGDGITVFDYLFIVLILFHCKSIYDKRFLL